MANYCFLRIMKNLHSFLCYTQYRILVFVFFVIFSQFFSAKADTIPENSFISGHWTIENSPYIVMGLATIPENDSLLIDPGVEVFMKSSTNFDPDTGDFNYNHLHVGTIFIMGQIRALGTESDSILFTRNSGEGKWGSIVILSGSSSFNEIKYCSFNYSHRLTDWEGGVNDYPGTVCNLNKLIVENCTFSNNLFGIYAWLSETKIVNSRFNDNYHCINGYQADLFISNCDIANSTQGIVCHSSSGYVTNSNIHDCIEHGINLYETSNFIVRGNTFKNTLWDGIHCSNNPSDTICYNIVEQSNAGIRCSGQSPVFHNNTVVNNNYFGFYLYIGANPIILNTIIYDNPNDFYIAEPSVNAVIANSLIASYSLYPEVTDGGNNLYGIDPLFVNYVNGDYNLAEGSPCVDVGTAHFEWNDQTIIDLIPDEYNGNAPDMGALESPFTVSDNSDKWNEKLSKVDCYPNPFSSDLQVVVGMEEVNRIYLLDNFGHKVFEINNFSNSATLVYPTDELPKGLYYLIVETVCGNIPRKLVKN